MWETVKLGDVCEIQPKKAQVKKKLADTDTVSFMPMDDLGIDEMHPIANQTKTLAKAYSSYTYFEDNDVLLAKITPCFENGKLGIATNLANGVGFGSSEYIVLRCSEQVLPQYIYYHLNQPSFRANGKAQMSGAVGHKRVPKDFVENLEISLPPLAEQQRIVAKLDAAFAEIDRAIAVSKAREQELSKFLLNSINHYVSVERNLHWEKRVVSDVCDSIIDCINKTAPTVDEKTQYKMLRTTNIRNGKVDIENVKYVSDETYQQWTRRQVPQRGDVILTREAPMGEVGMILTDESVFLGQRMVSYRTNPSLMSNEFLLFALQSSFVQRQILEKASGAVVQHMRVPHTKALIVPVPSIQEQKAIVEKLKELEHTLRAVAAPIALVAENYGKLKSAILAQELQPPQSEAA